MTKITSGCYLLNLQSQVFWLIISLERKTLRECGNINIFVNSELVEAVRMSRVLVIYNMQSVSEEH